MPKDNEAWAEKQVNDALRTRKKKSPSERYHIHLPGNGRQRYHFELIGYMNNLQVWRCRFCLECMLHNPEDPTS